MVFNRHPSTSVCDARRSRSGGRRPFPSPAPYGVSRMFSLHRHRHLMMNMNEESARERERGNLEMCQWQTEVEDEEGWSERRDKWNRGPIQHSVYRELEGLRGHDTRLYQVCRTRNSSTQIKIAVRLWYTWKVLFCLPSRFGISPQCVV